MEPCSLILEELFRSELAPSSTLRHFSWTQLRWRLLLARCSKGAWLCLWLCLWRDRQERVCVCVGLEPLKRVLRLTCADALGRKEDVIIVRQPLSQRFVTAFGFVTFFGFVIEE